MRQKLHYFQPSLTTLIVLCVIALASPCEGNSNNSSLSFTKNNGQWPNEVLFRAAGSGTTMWFTKSGVHNQLIKKIPRGQIGIGETPPNTLPMDKFGRFIDSLECIVIKSEIVGANEGCSVLGLAEADYKCNFFFGNDPSKWRMNVSNFAAIQISEIYPGIDLKYYGNENKIEYDFIVSPGADYKRIKIRYEGAALSIGLSGELKIKTAFGELIEQPPVISQSIDGEKRMLEGNFVLEANNTFSFSIDTRYNPNYELVIDPLLVYSTYLGGSNIDEDFGGTVNSAGEAVVIGYTNSANYPLVNAYQPTVIFYDVSVTKMNAAGTAPLFSTYLGGSDDEYGYAVDVDGSGAIYLTGQTLSNNYPTENPYQTHQGDFDVFVSKMSPTGDSLIYSTYVGGTDLDNANAIAVDTAGCAYVTGYTFSSGYPTVNPYQTNQTGFDVIVSKLSSAGNSLVYSTYLGAESIEFGQGIAVDNAGAAYVSGYTNSTGFPTMNAYQTDQPLQDAFVTKLNPNGSTLAYSTYLGGSNIDQCFAITIDGAGAAYVTGGTGSIDFPTLTPYQTDTTSFDVFVTKLSSAGSNLFFSTYLGGNGQDFGYGIAIDATGKITVAGSTASTDFPQLSSHQGDQGTTDAFVTRLTAAGTGLVFSTYLGGDSMDVARAVSLDGTGAAYVCGYTLSPNFPTLGPYQTDQGKSDVFVAKLGASCCIGIRGDCNGDGNDANILDLTFLVDRIFRGGPVAPCPEEADVNSDGTSSNILDLTRLVDRIFRGGPSLGPC